ncbi:MAG TPA: hypothetical protein VEX70_00815 [Pyrinomonadaceae bacterium]|jgi:hypothetical protein|nr:hypothetical protein [Pyrinomonadaceae bacterium]
MNYPLEINFKLLAIAQQLSVIDAQGNLIFYVKRKAFKLKEAITVFADAEQTRPLYEINADRVMDFSARYNFTDNAGNALGSIRRLGMRSLWKSHYEIEDRGGLALSLKEESAWIKVFDSLLGEIPVIGALTGYLFHPAYLLTRPDGTVLLRMEKRPAFFEGKFGVERRAADITPGEETRALLGMLTMVLLERSRG